MVSHGMPSTGAPNSLTFWYMIRSCEVVAKEMFQIHEMPLSVDMVWFHMLAAYLQGTKQVFENLLFLYRLTPGEVAQ